MGLESVEFILELESACQVSLSDADLSECRTPRQMIDLLSSKLRAVAPKTCQTQRAFHLLRKSIMQTFGVARSNIRLSTPIKNVLPRGYTRGSWAILGNAVHATVWPQVGLLRWMEVITLALALCSMVAAPMWVVPQLASVSKWLATGAGMISMLVAPCLVPFPVEDFRCVIPWEYGHCG